MSLRLKTETVPPCGWRWAVAWVDKSGAHRTSLLRGTGLANLWNQLEIHAYKNGYRPPSYADFEDTLCRSALAFDPDWDGVMDDAGRDVKGATVANRLPIAQWGPSVWGWLHLYGTEFRKDLWDRDITRVFDLLSSDSTGCPECLRHFNEIVAEVSPLVVETADEAAVWSWWAHNSASGRDMPFLDAALFWGWNVLRPHEESTILASLRARKPPY